MGNPVARIGDTSSHGGAITSGSGTVGVEGKPVARVGDSFLCPIHGPTSIVSGSPTWSVEGKAVARSGSACGCGAIIIGGATRTQTD